MKGTHRPSRTLAAAIVSATLAPLLLGPLPALHATDGPGLSLHLSPAGNDANPCTAAQPLATLGAAQRAARAAAGKKPVTVWAHAGTATSCRRRFVSPQKILARPKHPWFTRLRPVSNPSSAAAFSFSWIGSRSATGFFRRRHPPAWRSIRCSSTASGSSWPAIRTTTPTCGTATVHRGCRRAARVARWSDPAGGFIHAMHQRAGGLHYRIPGKNADGAVAYEGGWQNNLPGRHAPPAPLRREHP